MHKPQQEEEPALESPIPRNLLRDSRSPAISSPMRFQEHLLQRKSHDSDSEDSIEESESSQTVVVRLSTRDMSECALAFTLSIRTAVRILS